MVPPITELGVTMKVILKRGPKGDREFPQESRFRAWQRANSLAWLHGSSIKDEGDTLVVDAVSYYGGDQPKVDGEIHDPTEVMDTETYLAVVKDATGL